VRRPKTNLEYHLLLLVTLGLVAFGLVMVYSASSGRAAVAAGDPAYYLKRQGIYAAIGLVVLLVLSRVRFQSLRYAGGPLLLVTFGLLVAVLAIGTSVNGARRWLPMGVIDFQPSELAKLAIVLWLAGYLCRRKPPQSLGELLKPVGLTVLAVCALILAEPDLGTAIAIVVTVAAMLVVAGTPMRVLGSAAGIMIGLAMAAIWLEPYRRERLLAFLDPWSDSEGAGFQTVQALIALGSGGFFGVGLGESVQKINFLPESTTDMIVAIVGEELGLVGVTAVVIAFAVFAYAGLTVAGRTKDPFAKLAAAGLTTLVAGQALVNLAAVLGLAPLTGIPLPFVSYGGSSLIVGLAAVGILLNIASNDGVAATDRVPDRSRRDGRTRAAQPGRGRRAEPARRERPVRRRAAS
jgi:cell division protein FtsW